MKKALSILLLCLAAMKISAQVKNAGFETGLWAKPDNWTIRHVTGYKIDISETLPHSGSKALKISGLDSSDKEGFQSFSQDVPIQVNISKKIVLSAYVKLSEVKGAVALWCQMWDSSGKQIGFNNSISQIGELKGNSDWAAYKLEMVATPAVRTLYFGAYLMGSGEAWFDDFMLEQQERSGKPPSAEAASYIDKFVDIVRKNALYSSMLDWADIKATMDDLAKGAVSIQDTRDATAYLINCLRKAGDNHSFLIEKQVTKKYTETNLSPDKPKSRIIGGAVGYIYIPAFGSVNAAVGKSFSDTIQQLIRDMDARNNITGWIVDLRKNTGGNMWPMLKGLKDIIGNGTPGYFVYGKRRSAWAVPGKPAKLRNPNARIAVLVGPSTASSGEMTAVSFIGKEEAKLFGQPTAGYTTANNIFYLSDGAMLALAVSKVADRNKKSYTGKIIPDIITEKNSSGDDPDVEAALRWISGAVK